MRRRAGGLAAEMAQFCAILGHGKIDLQSESAQSQLIDILIARLLRDVGGTKHRWCKLIGSVQIYSARTHAHCNWSVSPTGNGGEIAQIETLLDELRLSHPILTADR